MAREKVITLLRLVKENGLKIDIAADEICYLFNVVERSEQLVCPECKSTDCKTAIHTDYKECNKCYHYWEVN